MSTIDRTTRRWATFAAVIVMCNLPTGHGLAAGGVTTPGVVAERATGTIEPGTTEPDTTEPDTTEPDTTEPDTTEPDTTEPGTTDAGDGASSDDDADALTWVAIAGALALIGITIWWMMRSSANGQPRDRMDDDWPGQSEVV